MTKMQKICKLVVLGAAMIGLTRMGYYIGFTFGETLLTETKD